MVRPVTAVISRPSALTTPVVRVWSRPKGLPMANTFWPTSRFFDSPTVIGCSLPAGAVICSTARSRSGAAPTREAFQVLWSARVTSSRLASEMTWKLVTIRPCRSQMKPEPVPWGIS